jgi:adenylosuccinate synthase
VGSGPFPTELDNEEGEELRRVGNEFGAVTGRSRRCGWIDLVALRYAVMLSGVTKLIITKADVLDNFNPIRAAVAYMADGVETKELPYDLCDVQITPVLREFVGWTTPVSTCSNFDETPQVFKDYCKFVEAYLETKIAFISNGTGRDQLMAIL